MSELQDLFEQGNPIPKGVTRCGDHYAQTEYMLIDPYASNYAARFKGFMEGVKHQQAIIDEHTEVIKIQDADLRKYEKQIESLKAQLNNMEACYIEKKKERDEVQNRLKAVYALSRMRAAVIGSWKREELSIKVRKAISHLVKKEQALRGDHE